jgi:hypothetical protein
MKLSKQRGRRKAVAGVLGAILMFAMLFSVGTGFFIFINNSNLVYNQALTSRSNGIQSQLQEATTISAVQNTVGHIVFTVTNTGGVSLVLNNLFVFTPSAVLCTFGVGITSNSACPNTATNTTPNLPIAVSSGLTSVQIDTGITPAAGTYVIKVMTQRGSTFITTYPPSNTVVNALSSGALGDLFLSFNSFTYWSVTTSGCGSGPSDWSGLCLTNPKTAFTVPYQNTCYSTTPCDIFSVRITDLNQKSARITLDQFSAIFQLFIAGANSKPPVTGWYLISNTSNFIYSHFHNTTLFYQVPRTLVFASASCVAPLAGQGPDLSPSHCISSITSSNTGSWLQDNGLTLNPSACSGASCGIAASTFILTHGWEYFTSSPPCSPTPSGCANFNSANYGQNLPYVTTLYE